MLNPNKTEIQTAKKKQKKPHLIPKIVQIADGGYENELVLNLKLAFDGIYISTVCKMFDVSNFDVIPLS